VAVTHTNSGAAEHCLPELFNLPSTSERFGHRHVPRGAPSWSPDSDETPCKGADMLGPEATSLASEFAMGNIGLRTNTQATVSGNLLDSWAVCEAGTAGPGPWTTMHRSGTPASDEYQVSSKPMSLLRQPPHSQDPPRGSARPTQSCTGMLLRPSHTIGTPMLHESNHEPQELQTDKLTMQLPSQRATTGIPTMLDVGLQDVRAHDSQCAQCNLPDKHNDVEACRPQHHVNLQKAKPEYRLYGSGHSGSLASSSSVGDDHSCSVAADPAQSDRSQSNSREQPTSSLIDPSVTTLVVRNVPARYTKEGLLQELSPGGTFDFFYLPFNPRQKRAAGYCFVNFTSHEAAVTFCNRWHNKWLSDSKHAGRKLSIGAAEVQGLEANLQHLMCCGIFRIKNTKYLPSVFNADREMPFTEQTSSDILFALRANGSLSQSVEGSE